VEKEMLLKNKVNIKINKIFFIKIKPD
jgi:hypothetical protein